MKKIGLVLLVVALLATCAPVLTLAYSTGGDACGQAKTDAGIDGGGMKWLWYGAGCLFNVLGVLGGYLIPMPVPANRIMGKSADYVTNYTQCYQEQSKSDNGMAAVWGCVTAAVIGVLYWLFVYVLFAATYTTALGA
jgi:hypothetical protein